jgi:polyhydroxybutyrate depolymerase
MTELGVHPVDPGRGAGLLPSVVLGVMLVVMAACGGSSDGPDGAPMPSEGCHAGTGVRMGGQQVRIEVGGLTRSYVLDVPSGPTDEPRPLVIGFHGFGGNAIRFRRHSRLGSLALRQGFIAAFPEGRDGVERRGRVGRGWEVTPTPGVDARFVQTLLSELLRTRCIDQRRVFLVGVSNGGLFANDLACSMAGRLAGVAAVAGSAALPSCTGHEPIAVMLVHGRKDPLIAIGEARAARDWWKGRNGCGDPVRDGDCDLYQRCRNGPVAYCETDEGHDWPKRTARRIWKFFKAIGPHDTDS